jgi:hypothetical protein
MAGCWLDGLASVHGGARVCISVPHRDLLWDPHGFPYVGVGNVIPDLKQRSVEM